MGRLCLRLLSRLSLRRRDQTGQAAEQVQHPLTPGPDRVVLRQQLEGAGATGPLERAEHGVVGVHRRRAGQERLLAQHRAQGRQAVAHGRQLGLASGLEVLKRHAQPLLAAFAEIDLIALVQVVEDVAQDERQEAPAQAVGIGGMEPGQGLARRAAEQVADKQLVNYQNYYFVAIAYAYNNFAPFSSDPTKVNNTQDQPYLGSAHGAGGINIPVVGGMPNPANGAMGTTLNSDFGSGITITRLMGVGNGGNVVELNDASNAVIMQNDSAGAITYNQGQGPINVKVIDPVKVPGYDWVFQIKDTSDNGAVGNSSYWILTAMSGGVTVDTIYSERNIGSLNEQIIDKYGLSIEAKQVYAPGSTSIPEAYGNGYITSNIIFNDPSQPWLWGVTDQSDSNFANWIRSGSNTGKYKGPTDPIKDPCNFNDNTLDSLQNYENLLANFSPAQSTWAPYVLAAPWQGTHDGSGTQCGFCAAYTSLSQNVTFFGKLNSVNLVFTSDKTKWTRCAVIEMQEDTANLSPENRASKFYLRNHAGWNGDYTTDDNVNFTPVYSSNPADRGMSWFPGYAIDQVTGQRLNIVFGEDSYLTGDNGGDMIWNPSSNIFSSFDNSIIFGGKHFVYVTGTTYDRDSSFVTLLRGATSINSNLRTAYSTFRWVGLPTLNPALKLLSIKDGIIPTETTIRFRVNAPYAAYAATDSTSSSLMNTTTGRKTWPYYTFSTKDLAPAALNDHSDRNALLAKIYAVPNPYYGYSGYENSRFDTRVRIINLPANATILIYSLDGSLVRTLSKSDPSVSYIDWDVHNTAGLPIASGMYLMDIKAEGIGETVVKWFGAMRPIDATSY